MKTVTEKSKVTISYIGKLDNGEIFKTVEKDAPVSITMGAQELPPTLENALIGLQEGDIKKVRVPPEEGYGARQKMLVQELARSSFNQEIAPKPGMILSLKVNRDGQPHTVPATVMKVSDTTVTVDYNHPLAGHHLTYEVQILEVESN